MFALRACAAASLLSALGCAHLPPPASPPTDRHALEKDAARELDDFHAAASTADEARYFAHLSANAVFLGTDATERWDVATFRAYAHPRFAAGRGWTYVPARRVIELSKDGTVAWFDEDLKNQSIGLARGTGVLVRDHGRWLIAQYNLTVPIPNEKLDNVIMTIETNSPPPAPVTLEATYRIAYKTAAQQAATGALDEAAKSLLAVLPEAKTHPESETEFWLHNELTWIRWGERHNDEALAEVDAARATLDHATLPEAKRTSLRLHELWDRAYLLLEVAMQLPAAQRTAPLLKARIARGAYEALARPNQDNDGRAVLEAFFLLRQGELREAAAAARRVDVEKDGDLQDLYVISRAFDANGEHATAAAVRGRICTGNEYTHEAAHRGAARARRIAPARRTELHQAGIGVPAGLFTPDEMTLFQALLSFRGLVECFPATADWFSFSERMGFRGRSQRSAAARLTASFSS